MIQRTWANQDPCWLCGHPFDRPADITADHITPLARGGTAALANLAPAHARCNASRGASDPGRRAA